MLPNRETLLCSYRYDPLDRLVDCTPSAQSPTRRFYLKDRLATEIQGVVQHSIMQHDDQLLAQQQRQSGAMEARLLATDRQRSVLNVLDVARLHPLAYSPYGHRPAESGLLSLLGFNGERPDLVTGCYLLGNGYRAFNPVLMRFNSPDSWSPFGKGGLNAYVYCVGDPINRVDPSGHSTWLVKLLKGIGNRIGVRTPSSARTVIEATDSTAAAMGQGNYVRSTENFGPPPAYSPPTTPRGSSAGVHDNVSLFTGDVRNLPKEIERLENRALMQRSILDDITAGRLDTTPEAHAQRVDEWRGTVNRITQLKEQVPPPNYNDVVNVDHTLPDYNSAIRRG
jgi:RHS repeat-associated protein